jgi:hypothetical protein
MPIPRKIKKPLVISLGKFIVVIFKEVNIKSLINRVLYQIYRKNSYDDLKVEEKNND